MSRGLTDPTAHVGKPVIDLSTNKEYIYEGFKFSRNVNEEIDGFNIIRTVNREQPSGALFMFSAGSKKYGIIYYARTVTSSSSIKAGNLGLAYSGRKGATENLGIQSNKMIRGGTFEKRILNDQEVRCAIFKNSTILEKSILTYMRENRNIGNHIYDVIEDYFNSSNLDKFEWGNSFRESDINELGKYLGELVIGVIVLRGKANRKFSTNIFDNKSIKEFIVPDDPTFSGVDSAFITNTGEIIPISSKLGAGARASFFTNFLPKVITMQNLKDSIIKDLANRAKSIKITKEMLILKRGAKEIVYEYGIRDFLGIDSSKIKDTYQVFIEAKKNNITPEVTLVMNAIIENTNIDKKIKDQLPASMTAIFTREIAKRLNSDKNSIDTLTEVLSGKKFYQANLNINSWRKGSVYFNILLSGKSNIVFIGNKSAINDIDANHGLVNYELKYT